MTHPYLQGFTLVQIGKDNYDFDLDITRYGHMFLIHQMIASISVLFNPHTDNRHIKYLSHALTIYLDPK